MCYINGYNIVWTFQRYDYVKTSLYTLFYRFRERRDAEKEVEEGEGEEKEGFVDKTKHKAEFLARRRILFYTALVLKFQFKIFKINTFDR